MSSYHRRILADPRDAEALTLVRLGSGSNAPGYYMYHGGANPAGRHTPLMESQATAHTNWNDLPVLDYDFQAPLGAAGQVRPHYFLLRRLHRFLHAFGADLAGMGGYLPLRRPAGPHDTRTLRWAVRSDGRRGFVFVNHHERGRPLPDRRGVRFTLRLAGGGTLVFPPTPVTVPSGARFIWPFRLPLRPGLTLDWATAQPVTRREGPVPGVWFATTDGIPAQFGFSADIATPAGPVRQLTLAPGRHTIAVAGQKIRCRIIVLTAAESLRLFDRKPTRTRRAVSVRFTRLRPAGPARRILRAPTPHGVAAAPTDEDFAAAAWWTLALPEALDLRQRWLLRVHYTGDVARIHLGEKLLLDDFYHGRPVELALWQHARLLCRQPLRLAVLPLRKDAPIGFSPPEIRPRFGRRRTVVALHRIELVPA
ncbi:MAG: hypothetical protein KIT44_04560, partial [Opitutaceae bacterium]|nr:hypothetical protein [Opitutaceae bacterium]